MSLNFSCGALPCPAGLGAWLGVPVWDRGMLVLLWDSWWDLGGVESDLPVPSERQALAPEIWECSVCCSLHSGAQQHQDLCLGSSSSAFTWRCLCHGISVKGQRVLLSPWLCHCCDKHFPGFVCHSGLLARSGIVSALWISLLLPERGGEGSHSPLGQQFMFPLWIILSMCWLSPPSRAEPVVHGVLCTQQREDLLPWTVLAQLNTSFSWALRFPNEFGHLSTLLGMCRHSKCLPNLWLY